MRKFFFHVRKKPLSVIIYVLSLLIGGWLSSGLPPMALLIIIVGAVYLGKTFIPQFKSEELEKSHKRSYFSIVPVVIIAFLVTALAKMTTLFILWIGVWIFRGVDAADLLVRDNPSLQAYLDLLVCVPSLVLFFVLYRMLRPKQQTPFPT